MKMKIEAARKVYLNWKPVKMPLKMVGQFSIQMFEQNTTQDVWDRLLTIIVCEIKITEWMLDYHILSEIRNQKMFYSARNLIFLYQYFYPLMS